MAPYTAGNDSLPPSQEKPPPSLLFPSSRPPLPSYHPLAPQAAPTSGPQKTTLSKRGLRLQPCQLPSGGLGAWHWPWKAGPGSSWVPAPAQPLWEHGHHPVSSGPYTPWEAHPQGGSRSPLGSEASVLSRTTVNTQLFPQELGHLPSFITAPHAFQLLPLTQRSTWDWRGSTSPGSSDFTCQVLPPPT